MSSRDSDTMSATTSWRWSPSTWPVARTSRRNVRYQPRGSPASRAPTSTAEIQSLPASQPLPRPPDVQRPQCRQALHAAALPSAEHAIPAFAGEPPVTALHRQQVWTTDHAQAHWEVRGRVLTEARRVADAVSEAGIGQVIGSSSGSSSVATHPRASASKRPAPSRAYPGRRPSRSSDSSGS